MKKKYLIILGSCMFVTAMFSGCKARSTDRKTVQEKAQESKEEKTTDLDDHAGIVKDNVVADTEITADDDPKTMYMPGQEIRKATAAAPAFQIGDYLAILGEATVADLLDHGSILIPDSEVDSVEHEEAPKEERKIMLSFQGDPYTVTVKNKSNTSSAIRHSDVIGVYGDQGEIFSIGGIKPGDSVQDLKLTLGDPFQVIEGMDISDEYARMRAYYYTSIWDDKNILFLAEGNGDDGTVISFREQLPLPYLTTAAQLTDAQIESLILEHETNASPQLLSSPYLVDVSDSEYAASALENAKYTKAELYTLDSIKNTATFNQNLTDPGSFAANSCLVIEYEGTLTYSQEEQDRFDFIGKPLDPAYKAFGAFYVLNPCIAEDGSITSSVGSVLVRELAGMYTDRDKMLEDIFPGRSQGYSLFDDYSVSVREISDDI